MDLVWKILALFKRKPKNVESFDHRFQVLNAIAI